jgi:RimJ/RimL family protein N-acetyltransferase
MPDVAGRSTERVRLRPVERPDVDIFFTQQQDPEANRRANSTAQSQNDFIAHWRDRILGDDTVHARTVCADEQVAGYVVAWWKGRRRCVGYWVGREFWGRGVGTQALRQFLDLEPIRPLFADTDINNAASQRLLERCGFRLIEAHSTPSVQYQVFMLK